MHAGLVAVIVAILLMVGIPKSCSIVVEKKGLIRPDRSRPGDVVVLDFYGPGRHVIIDAVISTVYRNTILSATSSLIPGTYMYARTGR